MELPLEAQFRLRAIKSDIAKITDLDKAKDLLYKCFEYQLSHEYFVRHMFKEMYSRGASELSGQAPNTKDYL